MKIAVIIAVVGLAVLGVVLCVDHFSSAPAVPVVSIEALDLAAAQHIYPLVDDIILKAALKDPEVQKLVRRKLREELEDTKDSSRKKELEVLFKDYRKTKTRQE